MRRHCLGEQTIPIYYAQTSNCATDCITLYRVVLKFPNRKMPQRYSDQEKRFPRDAREQVEVS